MLFIIGRGFYYCIAGFANWLIYYSKIAMAIFYLLQSYVPVAQLRYSDDANEPKNSVGFNETYLCERRA
jgi:hypothetical protein